MQQIKRGHQNIDRYNSLNDKQKEESLYELSFFEAIVSKRPEYLDALQCLAEIYTRLGYYEAGLTIDKRICAIIPQDSIAVYNLACSLALTGNNDEALNNLEKAIDLGYDNIKHIENDSDLKSLYNDPRFKELIENKTT